MLNLVVLIIVCVLKYRQMDREIWMALCCSPLVLLWPLSLIALELPWCSPISLAWPQARGRGSTCTHTNTHTHAVQWGRHRDAAAPRSQRYVSSVIGSWECGGPPPFVQLLSWHLSELSLALCSSFTLFAGVSYKPVEYLPKHGVWIINF